MGAKEFVMEQELNTLEILHEIDELREQVDSVRPLSQAQEQRIMQKFRLEWTYHSTAIEGSSLDYGETRAFLLYGVTAQGKPFKDYLDVKGHHAGIDFLLDVIRQGVELTEADIRALHKLILVEPYPVPAQTSDGKPTQREVQLGEYKRMPNHVRTVTGEIHYYATPEETPILMRELIEWYRHTKKEQTVHPVVLASLFHHRFVAIHPFDDGNGRMARLLMNLTLMQAGYPPVIIRQDDRHNYYLYLSQADAGRLAPMVEYFGNALIFSLHLYLKGARGESIEENGDLDKELAIFVKELETEDAARIQCSEEILKSIIQTVAHPVIDRLEETINKFHDMFLYIERKFVVRPTQWEYKDFPSSTPLEQVLHPKEGGHIVVYQLRGFRFKNNPFGLEIQLVFVFDESRYHVIFLLEDNGNHHIIDAILKGKYNKKWLDKKFTEHVVWVSRFYHQILTPQEIEDACSIIGKKILHSIKERTNGRKD